jgi:hypothetical protein
MKASIAVVCAAVMCGVGPTAWAQVKRPPVPTVQRPQPSAAVAARRAPGRPGSIEVSGGLQWLSPGSLGTSSATLTPNSSSSPFTLFDASARMRGAPGIDARVTYNLSRRFAAEGGVSMSRPQVDFTVGRDAEGVPEFTASGERLSQFFVDGNVLFFLPKLSFARGRGRTFLEGGGGYLRQLHAGRYNVNTGTVYNGGAGIKYYFKPRPRGFVKGFGFRVDLRTYYRRGGFSFDERNTWTAGLGAGALVAF